MKHATRFLALCCGITLWLSGCTTAPTTGATVTVPSSQPTGQGIASFYADHFDQKMTANGETFKQQALTAAHPQFPFGTLVKVTNIQNGKSVTVRINDRGPYVAGRIIDLSQAAFKRIATLDQGVVTVLVRPLPKP